MKTWIVLFMSLSIGFSCTKGKTNASKTQSEADSAPKALAVEVYTVKAENYLEKGVYLGNIEPFEKITLVAHGGGRVNDLMARPSSKVEKGDSLCNIEADKASLQLKSAELSFKLAKDDVERMKQHVKAGSVSRTQLEQAEKNQILNEVSLLQAKENMEGALCKTPISGMVLNTYISKFDLLSPKSPTISIGRLDKLKIKVQVPENHIRGYKEGNEALIEEEGKTNKPINASISYVAKEIDAATRSFNVEVVLTNSGELLPGQTVRVHLIKSNLTNQIVIPQNAIIKQADQNTVMVADGGVAKVKVVEIGSYGDSVVLITKGISMGEQVIIKGQHLVKDNSPVILP